MRVGERALVAANGLFRLPTHPFNLRNEGQGTYAGWQFDHGLDTVRNYLGFLEGEAASGPVPMPVPASGAREEALARAMFEGKTVLDIGCGAAGKTAYYASLGARMAYGLEILEKYRGEAEAFAASKGLGDRFRFVRADAKDTGFPGGSIDAIVMNDAMEHVGEPEAVLRECLRVLEPGAGRLYVNFPPYWHPYGAHLSDAIGIPWVHLFFREATLVRAYKGLVAGLPDGAERVAFRIGTREDGSEYFSYINHMTIRRFQSILRRVPARVLYYRELPLRGFLAAPARLPLLKEGLVKMVVAVLGRA
jgi:SAM-dependent methyltransferase